MAKDFCGTWHYLPFFFKPRVVKAMVFPVVMYERESCTIKKAEHQRIDAFELWCWRRLLKVPWTARSEWVSEWVKSLSRVRLFATLWTVAYQASPSMGFSRQEYWSGLPFYFQVKILRNSICDIENFELSPFSQILLLLHCCCCF